MLDEVTVGIGVENKETLRATTKELLVRMKLLVPFVFKAFDEDIPHVRGYVLRAWFR